MYKYVHIDSVMTVMHVLQLKHDKLSLFLSPPLLPFLLSLFSLAFIFLFLSHTLSVYGSDLKNVSAPQLGFISGELDVLD